MSSKPASGQDASGTLSPADIRQARQDNPKARERDLATMLGVSEAAYVAAWCGVAATRIEPRVAELLTGLESLGEVMALTRNDQAVHEKIGVYDKVKVSDRGVIVVGDAIDLRIRQKAWVHAFAVEKSGEDRIVRSLQVFDAFGEAVHKVHLRPDSDIDAYHRLVGRLRSEDQSQTIAISPKPAPAAAVTLSDAEASGFREAWAAISDVHEFHGVLRRFGLSRSDALRHAAPEFAWRLENGALAAMMKVAASERLPVMCFVASSGVTQIHSGEITNIKEIGPWINVLDPNFHLHLRLDHVRDIWAVRKPVEGGHVTALEAYNENQQQIIQFFGLRGSNEAEREDWRFLIENLPRI